MGQTKEPGNVARHGIAFEDAIRIFKGPTLERVDAGLTMEALAKLGKTACYARLGKMALTAKHLLSHDREGVVTLPDIASASMEKQ